jgi:hypothetical protein
MDHDSIFTKHFFPWYLHDDYKIASPKLKLTKDEKALVKYAKANYGINITHDQIATHALSLPVKTFLMLE